MTRKKFKIMYPEDHWDHEKRGKPFHPPQKCYVVMTYNGVFMLVDESDPYMVTVKRLSSHLVKYDVVWK